jgi:hypothetical protein
MNRKVTVKTEWLSKDALLATNNEASTAYLQKKKYGNFLYNLSLIYQSITFHVNMYLINTKHLYEIYF